MKGVNEVQCHTNSCRETSESQKERQTLLTMDALLPQLLSFPPHPEPAKPLSDSEYDKHIKNLIQNINTIPASKLTSGVPGGGDLLDVCVALSARRACPELQLTWY